MQPPPDTGRRLALLVATSVYSDPELRELRAPGRDAAEFAEVLGDSRVGGFDVHVVANAASGEVQEKIEGLCADRHPGDQLLIYLSCHGVLDSHGRLYYAAANTQRQRPAATAIASAWLNERLDDCRARSQILVLDCCHSGAFARGAKGDTDLALKQRFEPHGRGRVVLTASRGTEYSFEGDQVSGEGVPSVFTHAIVNGLRTGDADRDKDGLISVTDLYQYVYDHVRAAEPRQTPELWTYGAEGNLIVARSIRGIVIEPAPLPEDLRIILENPRLAVRQAGVTEVAGLLGAANPALALAARQALERIADEDRPQVAELARRALDASPAVAADRVRRQVTGRARPEAQPRHQTRKHTVQVAQKDATAVRVRNGPDRARLTADAERIAESITDESSKTEALARIAGTLAATDPDRADRLIADAERIAQTITDESSKTEALARIAGTLAATDPDRADRLIADAERIAQSTTDEDWKAEASSNITRILAVADPDRAERIAQSIPDPYWKAEALASVAKALAATDPDRAERIAQSITEDTEGDWKAEALASVAKALAATDPDRAERIAQSITDAYRKAEALASVAEVLAPTDPDRGTRLSADAERIAQHITDEHSKAEALASVKVAKALAATDPDQAAGLITELSPRLPALARIVERLAATDPDRAERIALLIPMGPSNGRALASVAKALAATDPDRAERIARSIPDAYGKAEALASVAEALAATDPDRAERIAHSITREDWKVRALVTIAEA